VCLTNLFLESGGPISFDSRLGVSFLTQVFGLVIVSSLADRWSSGGGIQRSVEISHCLGV
jgi:hypothetical protein